MLRKGGTLFDRIFSWPLRIKCVSGTERRGAEDNETVCIFLTQISGLMNSSNTSLFRGLANRDKKCLREDMGAFTQRIIVHFGLYFTHHGSNLQNSN